MSKNATLHLDDILDDYRPFRFGDYISDGFDIWKKEAGSYIGFIVVFMMISMGLSMIPILGQIVSSILVGPALTLGAAIFSYRTAYNEAREFGTFFDGFQFWKEILILGLIQLSIYIAIFLVFMSVVGFSYLSLEAMDLLTAIDNFKPTTALIAGIVVLFVVFMYLAICLSFAPLFIGFYKLNAMDAIRYGFRFGNRYFLPMLAFFFVVGLISMSGVILIFIGIILTFSMLYPILFSAFDDLTDLEGYYKEGSEEDINIDDMFGA